MRTRSPLGENLAQRPRERTEDAAHLGHTLDGVEHVDGKGFLEKHNKRMAGADGLCIANGQLLQSLVGARMSHQRVAGGFAKGDAELNAGDRVDQGFVDVLDRLDEMRLREDQVQCVGILDLNKLQFHSNSFPQEVDDGIYLERNFGFFAGIHLLDLADLRRCLVFTDHQQMSCVQLIGERQLFT